MRNNCRRVLYHRHKKRTAWWEGFEPTTPRTTCENCRRTPRPTKNRGAKWVYFLAINTKQLFTIVFPSFSSPTAQIYTLYSVCISYWYRTSMIKRLTHPISIFRSFFDELNKAIFVCLPRVRSLRINIILCSCDFIHARISDHWCVFLYVVCSAL